MNKEKLQLAIYKINSNNDLFSKKEDKLTALSEHIKNKGFIPQKLKSNLDINYQMSLFYKNNPLKPQWKDFFRVIAEHDQNILDKNKSCAESFVMLVLNTSSKNLYAVVGGLLGYYEVQDFIDDDFGVDILSRLITKEDRILKSVKEKSMMGGILGVTKFFRKNYNLFENDDFGKIYQELKVNLNKNILQNQFGFSLNDIKNGSTCIAKTSFKINKSINLSQLFQIISGCEYVLENPDNKPELKPISINNVEKIIKNKNQQLIQNLENELFNQLWKKFNNEEDCFDFDICHKEIEQYLTASKYIIKKNLSENNFFNKFEFEKLENIDILFQKIKELKNPLENKNAFIELIRSLKIYSYDVEDQKYPMTKGLLLYHIFGDVSFKDKKYFLIDNNWYEIKNSFINELNKSCQSFVKNNFCKMLNKKWNYPSESENVYNKKYISEKPKDKKVIVLDKITPDNIEPCDILMWDDDRVYFFHIKAGFGNTMRDLCSQIYISANRIKRDINSSREYIGKVYDVLVNKKTSSDNYFSEAGKQTDNITKDEFINILTTKKLVFVLSVLDITTKKRLLQTNISHFNSNIAKFSLQELIKGMKGIDVEFKLAQILKE